MLSEDIAALAHEAIREAQESGDLPAFDIPQIPVERPRQDAHGDFATPVCLQLARLARMAPMRIAQIIVDRLPETSYVGNAEVAKPGYINFTLSEEWLARQVDEILVAGERYGDVHIGEGRKVQVEFVSANPTGPLHVGSGRNAAIGDALANVLAAAGYDVQREYYVNDAGTQMGLFAETLYARYAQALGQDESLPEGAYQGTYMLDMGQRAAREHGRKFLDMERTQALEALGDIGLEYALESIRTDLALMGVHYDRWFSERTLYSDGVFDQVMTLLRKGNHVLERDGAVWFTATGLGGDKDEVIIRSGGAPGYFASDIAYHYDKFVRRRFDWVINVWGTDHQGHVPRMHFLMQALGLEPERLSIVIYQLVTLKRGGEVMRLSRRRGDIVTLREVLEDVGTDAVRFFLLSRSAESQMDFDLDLAVEQSNENPVYYIQYAHARISSILRLAQEREVNDDEGLVTLLVHPSELALIRRMLMLPEVVELAALNLAPHYLAHYAQDLAGQFHVFYRDCRVVSSDPADLELSRARIKLVRAARLVLARALHLMGMTAPEQM
ncbi:MAG: arginine--tRNA ligase [Anaerolineales bacterium]|nr:MAG: arginine--tRNA ligase [Anaerolineales bacterium]